MSTNRHTSEAILKSLVDPYRAKYGPRGNTHPGTYVVSLAEAISRGDAAEIENHCRWLHLDCDVEGKGATLYLRRSKDTQPRRTR